MKLLVVGATGRLGRDVVRTAAGLGHEVVAFARSVRPDDLPPGVRAWPGDATDPAAVDAAMAGVDAVIVALSMVRTSDWPWAPITTPLDLHTRAARALTTAAVQHGVRRYVMVSAHGVADSAARAGTLFLGLVRSSNIGVAYAELGRAEVIVQASPLASTILRPTRLLRSPATGRVRLAPDLRTTSLDAIPRADVAAVLVERATAGEGREVLSVTGA